MDHGVISLAANRDGVLWAEIWVGDGPPSPRTDLREERRLARFDGQAWEVFSWAPAVQGIAAVGSDGAVWLTDFYSDQDHDGRLGGPDLSEVRFKHLPVSFDGERWRRYPALLMDVASDPQNQAEDYVLGASVMAAGPDGSVWVRGDAHVRTSGLYVITPEAVAGTE